MNRVTKRHLRSFSELTQRIHAGLFTDTSELIRFYILPFLFPRLLAFGSAR